MQKTDSLPQAFFSCAIFVVLTSWAFFSFRWSAVALPNGDHWRFLDERAFRDSNLEFVVKSLSHARTRVMGGSDYFLFRPAMTGLLALQDVFLRSHLAAWGALSIFWHALTCFSLFLLLNYFLDKPRSCLMSLVFATQYAGKDMIVFRHVSPYIFALLFYALGVWALAARRERWSAVLFFTATLFHELIVIWLLALGSVLLFSSRRMALTLLLPVIGYCAYDGFDWLINARHLASPIQGLSVPASLLSQATNLLRLAGLFFVGAFLPWAVRFSAVHPLGKPRWEPPHGYDSFLEIAGFVLLVAVAGAGLTAGRRLVERGDRESWLRTALATFYLTFVGSFAIGRLGQEGFDYFKVSAYYFYFSNFVLTGLVGSYLARSSKVLFAALALLLVVCNYSLLEKTLSPDREFLSAFAQTVDAVAAGVGKSQGSCYGGGISPVLSKMAPRKVLFYRSCLAGAGKGLYGIETAPGVFALAEEIEGAGSREPVPLRAGELSPPSIVAEGVSRVLSTGSFPVSGTEIAVPADFLGAWIVGYEDDRNFVLVSLSKRVIEAKLFRDGAETDLIALESAPLIRSPAKDIELAIRRVPGDADLALYQGRMLLQRFSGLGFRAGRVGFTRSGNPVQPTLRVGGDRKSRLTPRMPLRAPLLSAMLGRSIR